MSDVWEGLAGWKIRVAEHRCSNRAQQLWYVPGQVPTPDAATQRLGDPAESRLNKKSQPPTDSVGRLPQPLLIVAILAKPLFMASSVLEFVPGLRFQAFH
jgi:hypothetical protein